MDQDRYICIHGHFYQPPRENPWLEAVEIQDSAYPYHDWNERIDTECYAPNSASRILDGDGRIVDIVSNYERISFNFGPTLLSWLEKSSPAVYRAIVDADRQSMTSRSGHGNAIAQVYNHLIMPLANSQDKRTQVLWGIRDFEYRFKRPPEGMWLSETAVDTETLEILSSLGIRFTILAPHQASRVRRVGSAKWRDVSKGRVDPTRAYLCRLPSGRTLSIFFYDGPISRGVAFEKILDRGEAFAERLLSGYSDIRDWPQLLSIATDGETYGHHRKFGDMALAYATEYIDSRGLAKLTNYGEYLERHPPTHEVQIYENSSWSCAHGIERWRSDCGCSSGQNQAWNQAWRGPLRQAFDWLRDELAQRYARDAGEYLKDPWGARDAYIEVILERSEANINDYLQRHAVRVLDAREKKNILKLLEMQRHALLMYTSCGWFFDEISGLETVQVIEYAGRALQLSEELFGDGLEPVFLEKLGLAKSNVQDHGDGAHIYEKFVKPAMIDLKKVGIHYAVSSLFEDYPEDSRIYTYEVLKEDYRIMESGMARMALGKILVTSEITRESEFLSFCVLSLGAQVVNGGVRTFLGDEPYVSMKNEMADVAEKGDFAEAVRLMDKHFGMHNYSFKELFRDQQRKILNLIVDKTAEDFEHAYRGMYERNRNIMVLLRDTGTPMPRVLKSMAGFLLNFNLRKALLREDPKMEAIEDILQDMRRWDIKLNDVELEFSMRRRIETEMDRLLLDPTDLSLLRKVEQLTAIAEAAPIPMNYWHVQNVFRTIVDGSYARMEEKARNGDRQAREWIGTLADLGRMLSFNPGSVLPQS